MENDNKLTAAQAARQDVRAGDGTYSAYANTATATEVMDAIKPAPPIQCSLHEAPDWTGGYEQAGVYQHATIVESPVGGHGRWNDYWVQFDANGGYIEVVPQLFGLDRLPEDEDELEKQEMLREFELPEGAETDRLYIGTENDRLNDKIQLQYAITLDPYRSLAEEAENLDPETRKEIEQEVLAALHANFDNMKVDVQFESSDTWDDLQIFFNGSVNGTRDLDGKVSIHTNLAMDALEEDPEYTKYRTEAGDIVSDVFVKHGLIY
ncbi:hypothetical protein [Leifsonia sp. Leaf264]|uniref:hypothetical protein n=1 Tax=Leifsonia sp. Leaf264 TaxID=1736314 RepID=UPI0006F47D08|nr:hypothetical protein [Leifsonia sp. Leaf264]KQO98153.1 hypothetical protein ASF30_08825 [Leifsonia sp. Leaf264]